MIQMTLIQIDNYGPWTVTPRPRTESDSSELICRFKQSFWKQERFSVFH